MRLYAIPLGVNVRRGFRRFGRRLPPSVNRAGPLHTPQEPQPFAQCLRARQLAAPMHLKGAAARAGRRPWPSATSATELGQYLLDAKQSIYLSLVVKLVTTCAK